MRVRRVGDEAALQPGSRVSFVREISSRFVRLTPRLTAMTLERIDPVGLAKAETYSHVVVATGSRLVFVAGQVAEDEDDNLVGAGDLVAQARQAFANLAACLAAAGARPEHVTKLNIYVVGHRPEYLPEISAARIAVFGDHKPADTIVGVERLAEDGRLIEVEAIAVIE